MIGFFANIFGYLLDFLYKFLSNYGLAIILFSIIIKLLMLPLSIKQQKSVKKNAKIQDEMKQIQFKYKNDPEKLNQETIELYKREKMNPFSGCFSAIIQIVLLFSVFYLVRSPLTYMKKVNPDIINKYKTQIQEENLSNNSGYPEIEIIREIDNLKSLEKNKDNQEEIDSLKINMEFLGLDLSKVPTKSLNDYKVYIIPVLYVISSFISMRISTNMQSNNNNKEKTEENSEFDSLEQANKSMSWIMPIMSVSIAIVAPLGLALYWLVNNVLMIAERLVLNRFVKDEEENENV